MNSIAPPLNYEKLLDNALRMAVVMALKQVSNSGFPGNHHFYISFRTRYPGVSIPEWLRERYPDEMTIVLQHQFSDLMVTDSEFSVKLSFNNLPQILKITVASLTGFSDPEAPFAVQFDTPEWSGAAVESLPAAKRAPRPSLLGRPKTSPDSDTDADTEDAALVPLIFPRNRPGAAPTQPTPSMATPSQTPHSQTPHSQTPPSQPPPSQTPPSQTPHSQPEAQPNLLKESAAPPPPLLNKAPREGGATIVEIDQFRRK